MNADAAQLAYLRWLSGAAPSVYEAAMRKLDRANVKPDLGDLGFLNFIVQAVVAAGSYVMERKKKKKAEKLQKKAALADAAEKTRLEKELADTLVVVNTKRAQAGMPPINAQGQVIGVASLPMPAQLAPYYGPSGQILGSSVNPTYLAIGAAALVSVVLIANR